MVAHDVGGGVVQVMARQRPELLAGIFLFDTPHPGIGARFADPGHLKEIWYQSFQQLPWAASLVGASRESCRTYFAHFLRHWSVRKDAFDDVLEAWVDNFLRAGQSTGRLQLVHQRQRRPPRGDARRGARPAADRRAHLRALGRGRPVLKVAWADRLGETFADLDFAPFEGVGHFPHREAPDRAAEAIGAFFDRVWGGSSGGMTSALRGS